MSYGTLKNWMKADKNSSPAKAGRRSKRPNERSLAERLQILLDSHGLGDEALNAFCRESGIFRHQIGRASCRERVCQYVWRPVVVVALNRHIERHTECILRHS